MGTFKWNYTYNKDMGENSKIYSSVKQPWLVMGPEQAKSELSSMLSSMNHISTKKM